MPKPCLIRAKKQKDDEWYTQYEDVAEMGEFFAPFFKDKIIFCNCDSEKSNFVKYFKDNFEKLGLKELLYCSEDFASEKSIKLLKKCDIVVTNPPYSLLRKYLKVVLDEYKKNIIFLGPVLYTTYNRYVYQDIKTIRHWKYNVVRHFDRPDGSVKTLNTSWYSNLPFKYEPVKIELKNKYDSEKYKMKLPGHDDAILINKSKDVPVDYYGKMGVPITFLKYFNFNEYDVLGITKGTPGIFARLIIKKKG